MDGNFQTALWVLFFLLHIHIWFFAGEGASALSPGTRDVFVEVPTRDGE